MSGDYCESTKVGDAGTGKKEWGILLNRTGHGGCYRSKQKKRNDS